MLGYVMLGTNDLARARTLYDGVAELLGASVLAAYSSDKRTFYTKGAGQPMLCLTNPHDGGAASAGNGTMVALPCDTRAIVDAIHAKAMAAHCVDEGAPGVRGPNPDGFYGAYFRDHDGNKICAFRVGPA